MSGRMPMSEATTRRSPSMSSPVIQMSMLRDTKSPQAGITTSKTHTKNSTLQHKHVLPSYKNATYILKNKMQGIKFIVSEGDVFTID